MVGQGINNILITSPLVGAGKLDRLMQLLERGAVVAVVVDDQEYAASMAAAAHRSGHGSGQVLEVLIDVDLGIGRTGVSNIESALQLVNVVCAAEGISYRGLQAYSGRVQHTSHAPASPRMALRRHPASPRTDGNLAAGMQCRSTASTRWLRGMNSGFTLHIAAARA
jgi:D-serine deaminase-like pyridoxal phosphate-dependent protein